VKTLAELKEYYENTMLSDLNELEDKRRGAVNQLKPLIAISVVILVAGLIIIVKLGAALAWIILPLLITGTLLLGWYLASGKQFINEYKDRIISQVVTFIDPALNYTRDGKVPKSDFVASSLFSQRVDYYSGDDLVSGSIGKTEVMFSEICAKRVERNHSDRTRSNSSAKKSNSYPIFKGLFFIADFNKDFQGTTVVLPDTAEKLLGLLGKKLQGMNLARGQLIKLEDPEFEKEFVVYADDQIESRYILSTSLMRRITDFKKKTDKRIFISFVASKVHDFAPIKTYYEDLQLAVGIVEDLNLNTRIWSKQQ